MLVPIVLPLALIPDVNVAVQISRLVATLLFALLGAAYAKNLNRNPGLLRYLWAPSAFAFSHWPMRQGGDRRDLDASNNAFSLRA